MTDRKYEPDNWLRQTFNWELVSGFGRSSFATASIAAPFIGYLIIYHSSFDQYIFNVGMQYNQINQMASCTPLMSGAEKLNFIYLGLTLIGFGSIVFRIFAPQLIKTFPNISEYIERELVRVTARNLRSMFVTIKARRRGIINDFVERAPWLQRDNCTLKIASDHFRQLKDEQIQIDVLRSFYNVNNRYTARFSVYSTSILYLIGFILISIPSFASTTHVVCAMYYGG